MSFNTIGYNIVRGYSNALFDLDYPRFSLLLADDVEIHHVTKTENGEKVYDEQGKDRILALYKEKLFDNTQDFDIISVYFHSQELQPRVHCIVRQTKTEEGKQYRAEFDDQTTLHIKETEKGMWKISKIITNVTKTILESYS